MKYLCTIAALCFAAPAMAQVAPRPAVPDATHVLAPSAGTYTAPPVAPVEQHLALPAPRAGCLRFTAVRIIGARAVPQADIAAQFTSLENRDITAADLKPALDAINALYAGAGLPLGRAIVPAQRLKNGVLTVRIVEGFIETVTVKTDNEQTKALAENLAAPLKAERPLTRATLERVMLLLQEIPGITLSSAFEAMNPQTGGTRLVINAHIRPVTLGISLDNRSGAGGMPVLPYLTAEFDNLLGWGDQVALTALLSPRQQDYAFYGFDLSRLVGPYGSRLGMEGFWAQVLDTVSLRPYAVRSQSTRLSVHASHPLLRSTGESLDASARLFYAGAQYSLAGVASPVFARDRFLALEVGLDYRRMFSSTLAAGGNLRLTQGLLGLADAPHTRAGAIDGFTRVRAEGKFIWQPLADITLNLSAQGQWSPDSLFASQEVAFGGAAYGRGFQAAEISGDRGIGLSFQPEYRIAPEPAWSISPYLLADYARAVNRRGDLQPDAELVSAGAGLKFAAGELATVTLEAAKPINRVPLDRRDRSWRFYAGLELGMDQALSVIAGSL
ncbi:MAG TPA: ShlB/FhaC/HecB family hemolysin secretion/activation protein [Rhizomicrobium sp.]|nr:ShlB/FhaC/HecB family hemolysin secretion/activation protein [Rhizomicrobium sp.]